MKNFKEQLHELLVCCKSFTYETFSLKGHSGYPYALVPDWLAFEVRCDKLITQLFGSGSAQNVAMKTALEFEVIGWGADRFKLKQNFICERLNKAIEILEKDTFHEINSGNAVAPGVLSNKVFVVHGHDEIAKNSLEILLGELGLEPVVLHRQADEGQTIIEKFEKHSDVGYAFIILTPDECAYLSAERSLEESNRKFEFRARPNVIFEFGYFVGKLGRKKVCCLHTGSVSLPSDVSGIIYKSFSKSVEEVAYSITKDLKAVGYTLK